jgi:hypothetical protein
MDTGPNNIHSDPSRRDTRSCSSSSMPLPNGLPFRSCPCVFAQPSVQFMRPSKSLKFVRECPYLKMVNGCSMLQACTAEASALPVLALYDRKYLAAIMEHRWSSVHEGTEKFKSRPCTSALGCSSDVSKRSWGSALRRESILLCRRKDCGAGEPATEDTHLPQRLYMQQSGCSVRVATAIRQAMV